MTGRNCDECRYDGGKHYNEDGTRWWDCPNRVAADAQKRALELTAAAHEKQTEAAKQILKDAAASMVEFSANQIRDRFDHADITDKQVIGAAFNALANAKPPVIEGTGRYVQSTDPATRHRIQVWRSLIYRSRRAS